MKKALSLVLMLVAALAFAACGNGEDTGCENCPCDNGACDEGLMCENDTCVADPCFEKEGDLDCPCKADDTCNGELVCQEGTCAECTDGELNCPCDNDACTGDLVCCEDDKCHENCCCLGQDLFISVQGMVQEIPQGGTQVDLAPVAPLDALSNGTDATHLVETTSSAAGLFSFDCFDVADISLGLVLIADDSGFDNELGTYYPTVTGIAGYSADPADKVCIDDAAAFVATNDLVTGLNMLPGLDADTDGFVIGIVLDGNREPLGGATVARSDGGDLAYVYYPNDDFSDFVTNTETSAVHGYYIIPGPLSMTALIGVKTDYTWEPTTYMAAAIAGAAYFVGVVADPQ